MSIISHPNMGGQRGKNYLNVIDSSIYFGERGMRVKLNVCKVQPKHLESVKRSEITTFSAASSRRLREALFNSSIPDSIVLGLTLTVPWHADDFEPLMDEWRKTFERFRTAFIRRFPGSAVIYRNELQKRGAPHVHAVLYLSQKDLLSHKVRYESDSSLAKQSKEKSGEARAHIKSKCASAMVGLQVIGSPNSVECAQPLNTISETLKGMWFASVGDNLHGGRLADFKAHGVKVDNLDASRCDNLFKYLADHSSKHKVDQLGYKGKQWGFIGRANLQRGVVDQRPSFDSPRHEAIFWRMVRKLTRYTIDHSFGSKWASTHHYKTPNHPEWFHLKGIWKRTPPFGCVHKGGKRRVGVIFIKGGRETLIKVWNNSALIARRSEPCHIAPA